MPRDSNIPLFLWIAAAIVAHLVWGGGADRVAHVLEEQLDLHRFALAVQRHVRMQDQPIQVALLDQTDKPKPKPPEVDKEQPPEKEPEKDPEKERDKKKVKHQDTKKKEKKHEKKAKPIIVPKLLPARPAPKKHGDKKAKPPAPLPKIKHHSRIAVRQHVKDKQKDNPTAEFIADQANTVAKQTQARITSTDQNDAHPTPGGHHSGPNSQPGDSDHTKIAQSEDRPGAPDLAPNDPGNDQPKKVAMAQAKPPPAARRPAQAERPARAPARSSTRPAQNGQKAQKAVAPTPASPDTEHAPGGSFSVPEAAPARPGHKARKARKKRLPPRRTHDPLGLLGLGAPGRTKDGVQLNLTPRAALAIIGRKELRRERRLDAQRRKSAHLGSWKSIGIKRWRSAIENYVPSVKPGNQTALNTARVPFASYINGIHNRLHPIFADSFLASLDNLPKSNPMNNPDISTNIEIVLSQDDGHIVRMGVTKTSGVTAFDVAALESVQRASPFGTPPTAIISPDGRVYLHWEFYRNPYYACSTYFARPFILKVTPKPAAPDVQPPPTHPYDPKEKPGHDQRHGRRLPVKPELEKHAALR
jgi:outer membrane biosynthesis protein TonB